MKPFADQDIIEKLDTRAAIRRQIQRAENDRIADTCELAAEEIKSLRSKVGALEAELAYIRQANAPRSMFSVREIDATVPLVSTDELMIERAMRNL